MIRSKWITLTTRPARTHLRSVNKGVQAMRMVLMSGLYAVSNLLVIATTASGMPVRNPGW